MSAKVFVVTGASSGVGRSCAIQLSKDFPNAVIGLLGRREDELKKTAEQCAPGTVAEVYVGDVTDEDDVTRVFNSIKEKYGRLDLLFNNAGAVFLKGKAIEDSDMTEFRRALDVNIMGAVLCTKAAINLMKAQSPQGGRIINNGSISSTTPRPFSASYTIAKHAILGLTKSTSLDGRKYNIACTQLDIGNAHTDMAAGHAQGTIQADGSMKNEPTMHVDNVARTVSFIAGLPLEADVLRLEIIATGMPFVGRG